MDGQKLSSAKTRRGWTFSISTMDTIDMEGPVSIKEILAQPDGRSLMDEAVIEGRRTLGGRFRVSPADS